MPIVYQDTNGICQKKYYQTGREFESIKSWRLVLISRTGLHSWEIILSLSSFLRTNILRKENEYTLYIA
jgi:hypothetical protein